MKTISWIALLGCLTILISCKTMQKSTENMVCNIEWKLETVKATDSDIMIQPKANKIPTLTLHSETNTISGTAGCNRIVGPYTLKGWTLKFTQAATTMMMCPDMSTETAVLKALRETDNFKILDNQLMLMKGETLLATYTK